jgi:hypothetical protein
MVTSHPYKTSIDNGREAEMRTRLLLGATVVATLLAWSACGKKDDSGDDTTTSLSPVGALAITCGDKSCVGTEGN